jgi:glycosyltransferase involved in cell wall biosynthesis
MHYLFIYPSPGVLGGIETLIARMSRWLVANGHEVSLLAETDGSWSKILPPEVHYVPLGKRFRELYFYQHAGRLWDSFNLPKPDVIKSFDLPSSWMACQLAAWIGNGCKVLAGIYNPLVFKWYYSPNNLSRWDDNLLYLRNYLQNIPPNNRLFCGVDQIEELGEVHQQQGQLWPIPIDTREFDIAERKPKWGKIVSVGRLSPMKEYNLYMIEAVKELVSRGHDVSWTVYGTGEYKEPMRAAIKTHGLEQRITLAGSVPYKQFWQMLEEAYVFVGMGTSVLEAALFKVPNVNALAYDREGLTHGSVCQFPPGSIGPASASPPGLKVVNEIDRILQLSSSEYDSEQESVHKHVQVHLIEKSMHRFVELVRAATHIHHKKAFYHINYPLWFVKKILRSQKLPATHLHPTSEMRT